MRNTFIIVILLLVNGVFGDGEIKVSVYEGESVTLRTNKILKDTNKVLWRDSTSNLLAEMINYRVTYVGADERFKDRLLISDTQTGDLTIKNLRIQHSGIYQAEIHLNDDTPKYTYNVTVEETPLKLNTVEVKFISVNHGESVTINTSEQIEKNDLIVWRFGDDSDLVAKYYRENNKFIYYDERFKNQIELNNTTGDLIISDVTTTHAGVYNLNIHTNKQTIKKTFSVSVSGMTSRGVTGLIVFFLLAIAGIIAAAVILYQRKVYKLKNQTEKSVSVFEEESITLQTGVKLRSGDVMEWIFGDKVLIAEINKNNNTFNTYDGDDGRFKGRLKLDDQTGSLTIRNIMKEDAGLYKLKITAEKKTWFQLVMNRGSASSQFDVVVYVRKAEGGVVTLPTGGNKLQIDDVIEWMYEDKEIIADFKMKDKMFSTRDGDDGRFKGRLEVNPKTGSLTISDINTKHSGCYKLKITSSTRGTTCYQFSIVVIEKIRLVGLGRSVTLDTNVTKINKDDEIKWSCGTDIIAQIAGGTDRPVFNLNDARFKDRIKMNLQTGSLTITNITVKHSGVYKLQICSATIEYKKYNVCILVPAKEGESVTLQTECNINNGDSVEWSLRSDQLKLTDEVTLVTGINGDNRETSYTDDWIFKDRLKMNAQTGDLHITDVKKTDAGFYTLQLINTDGKITYCKFSIHVFAKTTGNNPVQETSGGYESVTVKMF